MPDLLKRIFKIARASAGDVLHRYARRSSYDFSHVDDHETYQSGKTYHDEEQSSSAKGQNFSYSWPEEVIEDLRTFGLRPPSSLEEVKKARNAEIRRYHPDRFMNDPERLETSKKIMQIYNAAFERLEKWFSSQKT